MKKYTKLMAIVLSAALILTVFAGCASTETTTSATTTTASTETAASTDAAATESSSAAETTTASSEPVEVKELIYSHYNAADSIVGITAQMYVDYINEHSDTMNVTIYHNGELGGINETMEQVVSGAISMTAIGCGQGSNLYAPLEVFALPFLCSSGEEMSKLMDPEQSIVAQEIFDGFEAETGLVIVGRDTSPDARQLTSNFPVYSPDDLAGIKVRAIPSPIYTMAVEGLGGVPVTVDFTELPTALSTGVVACQENPITTIRDYSFWDYQDYIIETNHIFDTGVWVVNGDVWESLTAEEQAVITEATDYALSWRYEKLTEDREAALQTCLDNGMQILTEEDGVQIDAFKEKSQALIAEQYTQYAEYLGYIDEILAS